MTHARKYIGIAIVLLFIALGMDFSTATTVSDEVLGVIEVQAPVESNPELHKVVRIVDGDTFEIESGQKVRLIGIDTPEKGECYFADASQALSQLILEKYVRLDVDVSQTDRYGRLLRYVYVDDVFVNEMMVLDGYALATSYPPDVAYQRRLRQAQRSAQKATVGIWRECGFK